MSYYLRNVVRDDDDEGGPLSKSPPSFIKRKHTSADFSNHSSDLSNLLRHSCRLPHKGQILYLPTQEGSIDKSSDRPCLPIRVDHLLSVVAAPSSFGLHAIARNIVLKYGSYLRRKEPSMDAMFGEDNECKKKNDDTNDYEKRDSTCSSMAQTSVECMLSVLWQLSQRDSELCMQALQALLTNLQLLNIGMNESLLLRNTHDTLLKLYTQGKTEISSKAASCLSALCVSSFFPEFIFSSAATFLTSSPSSLSSSSSSILIPDNLHRLLLFVQQRAFAVGGHPSDWWSYSLAHHCVLTSFDLTSIPSDSSPETPDDDRRLYSAIASDGSYVYVLNYIGLYKIGTGFSETVGGKIYASNALLKSSRNCTLSFCNGSLYLRRGQSSRVWVLDEDSLRERGEIMLPTYPVNSTIFCDGDSFYQAHLDSHSAFVVTRLNDSFVPIVEDAKPKTKSRPKLRLTKSTYSILGDTIPVPHRLLHNLPNPLHGQVSDLHTNKDIAVLLARNGKVYYAGNGSKVGLQETGATWSEMALPETIVQIAVGSDTILFRSGSGHVWLAGTDEKKKSNKLRRLYTPGRRKVVSLDVSSGCFAYVTDQGKVYAVGKHPWRTHPETGMILGLEGVQIAAIALGKVHAVAISRTGELFTWGVNNLGQCGRYETPSLNSSPRHNCSPRQAVCLPTEHLFIRDVASLCVQCGKCSSRGAACNKYLQAKAGGLCPCGPGETVCLRCGACRTCVEAGSQGSSVKSDALDALPVTQKISLSPALLVIANETGENKIKIASVSCGNFHSILLTADYHVFTFGSNCHGQLGLGDTIKHSGLQQVVFPKGVQPVQVAAGSNHCVIRTIDGSVYTFGAHKAGQLGREETSVDWHCKPEPVPGFGPSTGTLAGWVGASGDATFIHAHTTLLAEDAIGQAQIVANKNAIFIFPKQIGKEYVVVKRKQNSFTEHQLGPAGLYTSYCLEPTYNVLWSYSAAEMRIIALGESLQDDRAKRKELCVQDFLRFVRTPEVMVPVEPECSISPIQMTVNLLTATYALTLLSVLPSENKKEMSNMLRSTLTNSIAESRSVLSRFESQGGGWGYSAHSVDAIQFKTTSDIRLLGIGLYGGRGEYNARVKMFRLQGLDGDELYVEEVATTDEVLYECAPHDVAPILFSKPITIKANIWHVISVKISGPSSDCGSNGHSRMESDGVTFTFRNSSLSNNGTDVTVGQIPELYFQNMSKELYDCDDRSAEDKIVELQMFNDLMNIDRVTLLRPAPSVYSSLLKMLNWTTNIVFNQTAHTEDSVWERERAALIAVMCLKILRFYTESLFPMDGNTDEAVEMTESIMDMYSSINNIFQSAKDIDEAEMDHCRTTVVEECISSMITSSHLLLSSPSLVLSQLSQYMSIPRNEWPLTALLYAMANSDEILTFFPDVVTTIVQQPMYPKLTERMMKTMPSVSERGRSMTSLQNVLSFLFDVAFGRLPSTHIATSLYSLEKISLVLIRTLAKELVKGDMAHSDTPPLMNTPNRFRMRSPGPCWDMTTGAVDAINLRVDKEGVTIAGIGLYLSGNEYTATFTIEMHRSESEVNKEEKWELIEKVTHIVSAGEGRDTANLKFNRTVPLDPAYYYCIKVSCLDGGKTYAGENGSTTIVLMNGARVNYSNSSFSQNGTCLVRGQIPYLLYTLKETPLSNKKEEQEKRSKCFFSLLRLLTAKVGEAITSGTMTSSSRDLCSSICGYSMVLMEGAPNRALEVVAIVDQLLPMVSSFNGVARHKSPSASQSSQYSETSSSRRVPCITVESSHPYQSVCVQSVICGFDKEIELLFIDIEECSRTVSADDVLWIYVAVDRECYLPVAKYSGTSTWKNRQLMLPGNSVWFILESSSAVEGADVDDMYGFRCSVHSYPSIDKDSNVRLEQELAWLSASACRLLVQLPTDSDQLTALCIAEEETKDLLEKHGSLLRKGLNLSHIPTLHELHMRNVPPPALSSELKFIREFISASSTIAGALARWLPVGPFIDPSHCQLLLPHEEFTVGSPAQIKLITRDQFGRMAQCNALNIEVIVRRGLDDSNDRDNWYPSGSLPPLSIFQQNPYVPVFQNKCRYMPISMMPAYSNYSFEELRIAFTTESRMKDTVAMTQRSSTTYCGTWFPRFSGLFRIECRVDGFQVPHSFSVEVVDREREKGEKKSSTRLAQLSRARLCSIPPTAVFSAIRIRTSPSLTASEMGILPRGSTVSYIEELDNVDGKWLRLTEETISLHSKISDFPTQAWCLQYHRALDRVLVDIGNGMTNEEKNTVRKAEDAVDQSNKKRPSETSVLIEAHEMYILAEGDRVELYSNPTLGSICTGETLEGRREIVTDGWIHNSHGVWIRVAALQKYILAEDAIGHSSVHSQMTSVNGNDDDDDEQQVPSRHQLKPRSADLRALRPSIVDCIRSVFCAFLWHEHLVKDAMAAASYLNFHTNLHNIWSSIPDASLSSLPLVPPPLQPLLRLWRDLCTSLKMTIDQHLIMPSPPAVRCNSRDHKESTSQKLSKQQAECELCDEPYRHTLTLHMRSAHIGCGGNCQGYGYDSNGKYTTGWTGQCGDGGRSGATWYLLCPACRQKYLRGTTAGHHQERKRRWREFRLSAAAMESRPENVLKQNALFLLELNASADGGDSKNSSTNTSGWTINLFPTTNLTPSPLYRSTVGMPHKDKLATSSQAATARRDSDPSFLSRGTNHASDPGPKGQLNEEKMHCDTPESLVSVTSSTASLSSAILKRPVMAFVLEHHDLNRVRESCQTAVHRAVAFAHAFRVWNWLLRLVSSESSVSDVILQYVWSLSSYSSLSPFSSSRSPVRLLPHPWRLCFLAGPLSTWMVQQMHSFLYTVAVILQSNTVDTRLRSLCFKAWTIQLSAHEQDLLILTCNILATVGGVLSEPSSDALCLAESGRTQEDNEEVERSRIEDEDSHVDVKTMKDVTSMCRVEASSRQAMAVCLTDGSTETFWESGEEDKSRYRTLHVRCENTSAVLLCLYLDNVKDEAHRVSNISAKAMKADGSRNQIHEQSIDQQFYGWVKICIAGLNSVQIVIKGPGGSVRIRQLVVFGLLPSAPPSPSIPSNRVHLSPSHLLIFSSPQRDAFALFQAISSQAFSDELSEEQHTSLRQRVLDLLFSRVHLQSLQTYVCTQMVNALEREVTLLRERSKRNYSYACGLMAMLVRVVASRKGTEVFAARDHLLITLSELLLFAPQVVQCQTLETMEKLFGVFHPSQVEVSVLASNLLVAIAKVISLQVKDKTTKTVNTITFAASCSQSMSPHWRLDKSITPQVGRLIMQLIHDITSGVFSSEWSSSMKHELATILSSIVHLSTDLSISNSTSVLQSSDPLQAALKARRFWMAVAALSVLKDKSWLESIDGWRNIQEARSEEPELLCDNHDDGRTLAQVHCDVCENKLCRDCFRILHLNKRNRNHEAHLIGEASSAPHVDIHDGCSRLRVHNILILLHSSALTGMVELTVDSLFPSCSSMSIGKNVTQTVMMANQKTRCRFCSSPLSSERQLMGVCSEEECIQSQSIACDKMHSCGHLCGGVKEEDECLPCMKCPSQENRQDGDDVCVICLIDRIGAAPALRLECGHVFHYNCLKRVLEGRWNGPRILFRFMNCPLCNIQISHPSLSFLLDPLLELRKDVETKAKMRLEYDGLLMCPAIKNPESEFYEKPIEYAMDRYMYVLCHKCGKAYFGGESRCQLPLDSSQYNPEELICGGCCDVKGVQMCGRHGVEFLEYKCRFCCSIAVFFCFGTTHFCTSCHDDFQRLMTLPKHLLPQCPVGPKCTQMDEGIQCPLRIDHAPTGEEFAMGCGICRNLSTF